MNLSLPHIYKTIFFVAMLTSSFARASELRCEGFHSTNERVYAHLKLNSSLSAGGEYLKLLAPVDAFRSPLALSSSYLSLSKIKVSLSSVGGSEVIVWGGPVSESESGKIYIERLQKDLAPFLMKGPRRVFYLSSRSSFEALVNCR